jgi:hypothetical protein
MLWLRSDHVSVVYLKVHLANKGVLDMSCGVLTLAPLLDGRAYFEA